MTGTKGQPAWLDVGYPVSSHARLGRTTGTLGRRDTTISEFGSLNVTTGRDLWYY
jgi:hypothetical protein